MTDLNQTTDYYRLLGVPYTASNREITRAYRDAMKVAHPDMVPPIKRADAEERSKLLNLAWRTLTTPAERLKYDQSIKVEAVQREIMSQYFGGMGIPGSGDSDRFGDALRRSMSAEEKREKSTTDRHAVITILLAFAAATALVVGLIVVWAAVSDLVHAVL
jgi:DnaJ-class molecular chaperone